MSSMTAKGIKRHKTMSLSFLLVLMFFLQIHLCLLCLVILLYWANEHPSSSRFCQQPCCLLSPQTPEVSRPPPRNRCVWEQGTSWHTLAEFRSWWPACLAVTSTCTQTHRQNPNSPPLRRPVTRVPHCTGHEHPLGCSDQKPRSRLWLFAPYPIHLHWSPALPPESLSNPPASLHPNCHLPSWSTITFSLRRLRRVPTGPSTPALNAPSPIHFLSVSQNHLAKDTGFGSRWWHLWARMVFLDILLRFLIPDFLLYKLDVVMCHGVVVRVKIIQIKW